MTKRIFHPRLQQIERYISEHRQVTTSVLCTSFDISEATARRDLDQLAALGSVMRVHGGAVAINAAPPEPPPHATSSALPTIVPVARPSVFMNPRREIAT